jgi:hypothetical protein
MIMIDFSEAQHNGLLEALVNLLSDCDGESIFNRLICGCKVHYMRSVMRVAKLVTDTIEEQNLFINVCRRIETIVVSNKQNSSSLV